MNPPRITIPAVEFGGTIGTQDVVFEVPPSDPYEEREGVRTGFLVDSVGEGVLAFINEYLADGSSKRKGVHVDIGSGQHFIELSFDTPVTQKKGDGSLYQWGYTSDDATLNEASATGASTREQCSVFANTLRKATPDSLTPATLEIGEYSPDGILDDSLDVVLESPEVVQESANPRKGDINVTMIETADIRQALDQSQRQE